MSGHEPEKFTSARVHTSIAFAKLALAYSCFIVGAAIALLSLFTVFIPLWLAGKKDTAKQVTFGLIGVGVAMANKSEASLYNAKAAKLQEEQESASAKLGSRG